MDDKRRRLWIRRMVDARYNLTIAPGLVNAQTPDGQDEKSG
jgi:hypothetical protein